MKVQTRTYTIPASLMEDLEHKIHVLQRRARKLDLTIPEYTVIRHLARKRDFHGSTYDEVTDIDNIPEYTHYVEVEVTAPIVNLPNWEVLGVVEEVPGGKLVHIKPQHEGELNEADIAYLRRGKHIWCDHCNTDRRRKRSFIIANQHTDEVILVGSTCIDDFIGRDTLAYLQASDEAMLLDTYLNSDGEIRPPSCWHIDHVLLVTMLVIRHIGWHSRREALESGTYSTSDLVLILLTDGRKGITKRYSEFAKAELGENDKAYVKDALAWIQTLPPTDSTYINNLRVACNSTAVVQQTLGLACSLIPAYRRHVEQQLRQQRQAQMASQSTWIGNIGDQINTRLTPAAKRKGAARIDPFTAEITYIREFEGMYGLTTMVKMVDSNGNNIVWFKSGGLHDDFIQGAQVLVKGTIKKLDEYRGIKQTVLTRAVLTLA